MELSFIQVPGAEHYWLFDATVPLCCIEQTEEVLKADRDELCRVDIEILSGKIRTIKRAGEYRDRIKPGSRIVNLCGSMCWPTMADLHTHIDKSHTCERSRNATGTLSGADSSTASDGNHWDLEDVCRRMDFSLRCAYAHGTSALRTHLINITDKQVNLTWAAFLKLKKKWKGKVELQGVSLVPLSYFRNAEKSAQLADAVKENGGLLGAAVCCTEFGGTEIDEWTSCPEDRDQLLDRMFILAKERDLDLDFHVDENGNECSKGLRHIAKKAIEHGYHGRVVCGHCCSLAHQSPEDLQVTLDLVKEADITVVSLPLVNEWTQDRTVNAHRTPRWRGITAVQELYEAEIPTALASDNNRDQFYEYGDLDMLEVFTQGVRLGQLDCPHSSWPKSVTSVPADAMGLENKCRLSIGQPADLILFRARKFSELLSRPQFDRVVIRNGKMINAELPNYEELDKYPVMRRGPSIFQGGLETALSTGIDATAKLTLPMLDDWRSLLLTTSKVGVAGAVVAVATAAFIATQYS